MKKMLTIVAGAAVIAGSTMGVANAQGKASGPFADVPTDHWAYQSVEKLRDAGIVIGYPDGTYGGRRAMTRYEFATAIARLVALIPAAAPSVDLSPYALKTDLDAKANQTDLAALQAEVERRLQGDDDAIAALKDLVNQFAPELAKLGTDVADANARIDALDKRTTALEEEVRRVTITGDVNFIVRSDINSNNGGTLPIDKDGYRIGSDSNKSIFASPAVYHDILLNIAGRVSDTAQAVVRIDAGNYLPWLGSATALVPEDGVTVRTSGAEPGADTFNIYEAYLTTPVALGPLGGASATIGRFGSQFTDFTFKAVDPDSYTYLEQTDSGNIIGDGAKVSFGVAGAHVTALAEKTAPIDEFSISGNPSGFGAQSGAHRPGFISNGGSTYAYNPIDQVAGVRATFGNPDKYTFGVTGLVGRTAAVDTNVLTPGAGAVNNLGVYGADYNGLLPFGNTGLTLDAEFALDQTGLDSHFGSADSNKNNYAWKALLGYNWNALTLKAGYRQVGEYYAAPGYWEHIGTWINPTNVKGPEVYASYPLGHSFALSAEGQFYEGINSNVDGAVVTGPLGQNDKYNRGAVGLKYGLSSVSNIDLGYEYVQWDLKADATGGITPGKPTEQYITIGFGHDINKNTAVKLLYQIIDYTDAGTGFDTGDSNGGALVGQASVKF